MSYAGERLIHESVAMDQGARVDVLRGDLLHYTIRDAAQHQHMIETRYAPLGAQQMLRDGRRTSSLQIKVSGPAAFVRSFVLKGGWRDGFFVNDVWQASRDLTFSLGLRYELNTPVQTYAGLASMLSDDFETIIPSSFPAVGFEFSEPNYKDIAPRLGATYRLSDKTVVRAGYVATLQAAIALR